MTDTIRQELGISPTDYQAEIGEYIGADSVPPANRYQVFLFQYNSTGSNIWYNFIDWNTLVNGDTTVGINGNGGLNVSGVGVSDKLFSANLGTLTRPTAIRFFTISTIKITESALGDTEVVGLFKNTFRGSYGEDLSSPLLYTVLRPEAVLKVSLGIIVFHFLKLMKKMKYFPAHCFPYILVKILRKEQTDLFLVLLKVC